MSHSSDIVEVLNDLMDKVQTQLDRMCHAESNAAHNFALLRQSLEDQLALDNKALTKAKAVNSKFASSLEAELILRRLRRAWQLCWRLRPQARPVARRWPLTMRFP